MIIMINKVGILTFDENPVETLPLMTDAVKALPALAHVRALRPTGAHAVFVHSTAGALIQALEIENCPFSFPFTLLCTYVVDRARATLELTISR